VLVVAFAILAAATYALMRALGSTGEQPGGASAAGQYVDPRFGWTIHYPKGMVIGPIQDEGLFTTSGVRITNFKPVSG
jgi:hypothetical protein